MASHWHCEDASSLSTLRVVLSVVVEDDEPSSEFTLVERLRRQVGVHERSKRILLASAHTALNPSRITPRLVPWKVRVPKFSAGGVSNPRTI